MELGAVDLGQRLAEDQPIVGLITRVETDSHLAHFSITSE